MVRFGHTLNDTFEEENPDENRNNEGEDTMMVPWKKRKRDQLSLSDDEDDYEDDYDPRVDRDHDDMREPWQMDDYDDDDQYQNDQYVRNRSSFMNRSSSSFRPSSTNQNHMYQQPHHNHIMQHHYQQHPMMSESRMDMNPNFMQTHVPRNYDDYNEQYGDASYDMENKGSRKSKIIRNLFVVFIAWFFMRHTKELSPSMSYVSFFTTQMLSEIYILLKQDIQSLVSHVQKSSLFSGSNTSNNISSEQQRNKHCTISVPSVELPPILTKTLSPKFLDIYNAKVQHESEPSSTSNVANNIESSSISELFLLNNIVGQDRAMSVVSHAIDGWVDNMGPNSSETDYIKPMAMLFTGSDGVGKTETSFLLSKLFFSNCYNNIDGGDGGDGGDTDDVKYESVLLLHGQDFNDVSTKTTQQHTDQDSSMEIPSIYDQDQAVDQFSQNSVPSKERLRQKVLQHLYISQNQKKTTGSVIILTQVDQVHDLSTLDIFYDILNGSEKNPAITTTLSDEQAQQVEISTSHLLVIFTTDLATDRIFRMLQKYSSSGNTETESEIPKVEMTSAIRDALDSHWSPTSYSGRSRVNLGKVGYHNLHIFITIIVCAILF